MRWAVLAGVIIFSVNAWVLKFYPERFPQDLPKAFAASHGSIGGTRDLVLVGLGLRRLAADMAMIDLLVYYGSHENAEHGHEHGESSRGEETRSYADLFPLARRILGLDPYFRYAVLYAAGALAFNENRTRQAVDLLNESRLKDPTYWPYSLTLSSIAYKKTNDFPELVRSLEPLVTLPECPSMLKNILANIYLKIGRRREALNIFRWLRDFAPEEDYRSNSRLKLEILGVK